MTFYYRYLLINDGLVFIEKALISSDQLSKVAAKVELKRGIKEGFRKILNVLKFYTVNIMNVKR